MRNTTHISYGALLAALLALSPTLGAQGTDSTVSTATVPSSDTSIKVIFGGFVDTYYAYDFNRPASFDRPYTTQPARHDEFNVNLVFVEAKLDARRIHGRLALQAGTSVQANYASEPSVGSISGPSLSRSIQEAFAGYNVANNLWIDGGIFLSHIGSESFISRDNWTYSRSLIADYTPYYESGVRAVWKASSTVTATAVFVNGWQNISETNSSKSIGLRLDYAPSSTASLSYDNFIGNERPDSVASRLRVFNEVIAKVQPSSRLGLLVSGDYGVQRRTGNRGSDSWHGAAFIVRFQATPVAALNGRLEYFGDPGQVLITVPAGARGFRSRGASVGVDLTPDPHFLWRTELRGFGGRDPVFPRHFATSALAKRDAFIVTSVGLTL